MTRPSSPWYPDIGAVRGQAIRPDTAAGCPLLLRHRPTSALVLTRTPVTLVQVAAWSGR